MGFTEILTLIFITLKLTHYIDWSWWWVISPTLIGVSLTFIILFLYYFFIPTPKTHFKKK